MIAISESEKCGGRENMEEYIILTSDYAIAAETAKEIGIEIGQWKWIRDRFKDPLVYKKVIWK